MSFFLYEKRKKDESFSYCGKVYLTGGGSCELDDSARLVLGVPLKWRVL